MEHIKDILLRERYLHGTPNQRTSEPKDPIETAQQKRAQWLLGRGGVTDLDHTFDKLRCPKGFKATLDAFKELAAGTASWHMLMVYGHTGNGKTLCCEALVIALYDRGVVYPRREKWSDIIRFTLKPAFHQVRPDQPSYADTFRILQSKKNLVIDDVGMGSTGGNWEWGELEDIIDYRLEHQLLTVITTNLDATNIPPRIISRFKDKTYCRLICNEAADQRGVK